ncbi:MAG: chromosome segregation protein SMC [Deltaproteobacteria bacterium]
MRIREIDLVGFKSFRDPTKLRFEPGLNGIVGPNGCGKSNVADAIRWALGEQSVKNLRARDMSDIIFCGNDASQALNFAEVTLTFERTGDGDAPTGEEEGLAAQIARLSEFSVTRRIDRNGDSQYLVNQAPARLRDITEIFLGSGLGLKAYAMIEQGRVMQLVNAKPETVRLFIEEAAGTTRFRVRKIAAERKLDRTTENLARVSDVMREIERQLGALQRQAKRAEEFKRLEAELRDVEIYLSGIRFQHLAEERHGHREDLTGFSGQAEEIERRLGEFVVRRDEVQVRDRETQQAIEQMFAALADVASAVVRATERATASRETIGGVEERVTRVRAEDEGLAAQAAELAAALEAASVARQSSEEILRSAEQELERADMALREAAPAFETAETACGAARHELGEARAQLASVDARRAEVAARVRSMGEEGARIEDRRAGRRAELASATQQVDAASERELAARSEHGRLEDDRKSAAETLRVCEDEMRRLEETQAGLRETQLHVRGRIDGLRERERSLDGFADGIDSILERDDGPLGLLVDTLGIPADLEPAVAAVLGDVLRGAVVEGPEDGARLAEALRNIGEGRISFVPRSGAPACAGALNTPGCRRLSDLVEARQGFENIVESLFGHVMLADDLATAVSAFRASPRGGLWVTRAGDLVDERGVVTGGQVPEGVDLLERRRVLAELEEQQLRDEATLASLEERLVVARQACAASGEGLQQIDARAHDATLELVAAEHALAGARRERAAADARIVETEEELRIAGAALNEAQARSLAIEEEATAAQVREGSAQRCLDEAAMGLESSRQSFEAASGGRDEARQVLAESRQVVTQAVADQARQQHSHEVVVARRRSIEEEVGRLESERDRAAAALVTLNEQCEVARSEHATREAAVERARTEAREIAADLARFEGEVGDARTERDSHRDRIGQLEVRIASLDAQIEGIEESATERYEVVVADVQVPEDFDAEIAAERATVIKTRIERLGAVNITAIADAQELAERFDFLQNQRGDLEASMEDLRKTIGELSRTTRTRFKDTFDQARELFGKTFKELFRGGTADLVLTQPNNLMETGVEIVAQPPGKAVRSLEMLSGGERSLTAVSLIMALFQLRPPPFCLLDEVDAPLDDTNVGRFSSLLKRLSADTQFLIITHKPRTMEQADSLYGVTMPEPGVSQIVSVQIDEINKAVDGELAASA